MAAPSHGFQVAVTLYDSGTLTLDQAAHRAGLTPESFSDHLARYGIDVDDAAAVTGTEPATAD